LTITFSLSPTGPLSFFFPPGDGTPSLTTRAPLGSVGAAGVTAMAGRPPATAGRRPEGPFPPFPLGSSTTSGVPSSGQIAVPNGTASPQAGHSMEGAAFIRR